MLKNGKFRVVRVDETQMRASGGVGRHVSFYLRLVGGAAITPGETLGKITLITDPVAVADLREVAKWGVRGNFSPVDIGFLDQAVDCCPASGFLGAQVGEIEKLTEQNANQDGWNAHCQSEDKSFPVTTGEPGMHFGFR